MKRKLVWVTGAAGLIGNYLMKAAPEAAPGFEARGLTRAQLDLTDFAVLDRRFREEQPDVVVHCAALSQSPVCQNQPEHARALNIGVTAHLAQLAANVAFVFFSSDLVFDGQRGNYDESAAVNPRSVYAETKVAAEQIVLRNPLHTVIRTSLNGGTSPRGDRAFNEEMRRAWEAGQTCRLFTDEFRSPIPAAVTARATWEMVLRNQPGLYHLAGNERLSRWQIGQLIAARWPQLKPRIEPDSLIHPRNPPRSPDTSLNCAKAQALLSFPLPGLAEWLAAHPTEPF